MAGRFGQISLLVGCLAMLGCASIRESRIRFASSRKSLPPPSDVNDYLLAAARSEGVYISRNDNANNEVEIQYPRRQIAGGRAEGVLAETNPLPLRRFLDPDSTGRERDSFPWANLGNKTYGYFVTFHSPVPEFPVLSRSTRANTVSAGMTAYDSVGTPFADGVATRTVSFAGIETARGAGREFPECARINVETGFSFGWWCKVQLHESMLVDRKLGVIERSEHVSGNAMIIFNFVSDHVYELAQPVESEKQIRVSERKEIPRWTGLAIQMDRVFRQPAIRGLIAEFETSNPASKPFHLARE